MHKLWLLLIVHIDFWKSSSGFEYRVLRAPAQKVIYCTYLKVLNFNMLLVLRSKDNSKTPLCLYVLFLRLNFSWHFYNSTVQSNTFQKIKKHLRLFKHEWKKFGQIGCQALGDTIIRKFCKVLIKGFGKHNVKEKVLIAKRII